MKYHLSKRQFKELSSGASLQIALPVTGGVTDVTAYAPTILDVPPNAVITAIEDIDVPINPLIRSSGLSTVFGAILHREQVAEAKLVITIRCAVVTIGNRNQPPHTQYPHQWPGSVTLDDGSTLP